MTRLRSISLITRAVALAILLSWSCVRAAPPVAQDRAFGEALFFYFQEDYISAITRLRVAQGRAELSVHAQESELMLGGLMLGYGMHRRAEAVFERLLASHPRPSVRDQAWYFLAQSRFLRGFPAEALSALERVGGDLPGALVPEKIELQSRALLATGRPAEAASLLAGAEMPGGWRFYGWYNQGVALNRAGQAEEGDRVLDRLGRASISGNELRSLRDRANLALGYTRLSRDDPAGARSAFDRVGLDSPFATRALLGAGWADSTRGDYASAMGPWHELGRRDPLDAAVQESLIAVPYAFAELDAPGRAVASYETAVAAYEVELERLDGAVESIGSGVLLRGILGDPESTTGDEAFSRYLYALMAEDGFQQAVSDLRDLDRMKSLLDRWSSSVEAFSAMLEARRARFDGRNLDPSLVADTQRLAQVEARQVSLAKRIKVVRETSDVMGLADEREIALIRRIAELESLAVPGSAQAARLERLRGVVFWQAHSEYPTRLRSAEKAVASSGAVLAEAKERVGRIDGARSLAPEQFDGFDTRISAAAGRLAVLRERVDKATRDQAGHLEGLAVAELQARKARVTAYLAQARFALAASYDRASFAEAQR